jgi:hypothetical protein
MVQNRDGILTYCEGDVRITAALLPKLLADIYRTGFDPKLSFGQALLRGRYMGTSACMERNGIPFDVPLFRRIRKNREEIRETLLADLGATFDVYTDDYAISRTKFEAYLIREGIRWPQIDDNPNGKLNL